MLGVSEEFVGVYIDSRVHVKFGKRQPWRRLWMRLVVHSRTGR